MLVRGRWLHSTEDVVACDEPWQNVSPVNSFEVVSRLNRRHHVVDNLYRRSYDPVLQSRRALRTTDRSLLSCVRPTDDEN